MTRKETRQEARLVRKNKARRDNASAESASIAAEKERLRRLLARGEEPPLKPMSAKDRKMLSKKPLISKEQRKSSELAKHVMAMCKERACGRK